MSYTELESGYQDATEDKPGFFVGGEVGHVFGRFFHIGFKVIGRGILSGLHKTWHRASAG